MSFPQLPTFPTPIWSYQNAAFPSFTPSPRNYPPPWIITKLLHQLISSTFILNFSLSIRHVPQTFTLSSRGPCSKRLPPLELLFCSTWLSWQHFLVFHFSECSFIDPFYTLLLLAPKYSIPQHSVFVIHMFFPFSPWVSHTKCLRTLWTGND